MEATAYTAFLVRVLNVRRGRKENYMFTVTTVDSILKDFTVKIEKLKAISSTKMQEVQTHQAAMDNAEKARETAKAEAVRAAQIASRIEALVG